MTDEPHGSVALLINGKSFNVPATDSVAMAVLRAGLIYTHINQATGQPRSPYCMMGVCFECVLEIDGKAQQACLIPVSEGMSIRSRTGGEGVQ